MEYYNLLNLPFDATPEEIRAAYFTAARKYHPDAGNGMDDGKFFIRIQEAYEVLSNPKRRKEYDRLIPEKLKEKSNIKIDVLYSQTSLSRSRGPQLLYVLLDLSAPPAVEYSETQPIYLCIILDRSTSMRGERMDMVRRNIDELIRWLRPNDIFSLVTFSDRAETVVYPTEIKNAPNIAAKIYGLESSGSTEIYQGLQLGYETFKRLAGKSNFSKHLLLVTDGHTYGDEERCYQLAGLANQDGIVINCFGIGSDWNDQFLDKLSVLSGGNAAFIQNEQDLKRAIGQKVRAFRSIFAQKAELFLDIPPNVKLQYAFRNEPDVSPLEVIDPIQLGHLGRDQKTSVILEFIIDRIGKNVPMVKIASGKLMVDNPSRAIPVERYSIDLKLPVSREASNEPPPAEIMRAMSRISLYRLQERAKEKINAGDIDGATKYLKYLATGLLNRGDQRLAGITLSEIAHLQTHRDLTKDGEKMIKYGTRALFLLPGPENVGND